MNIKLKKILLYISVFITSTNIQSCLFQGAGSSAAANYYADVLAIYNTSFKCSGQFNYTNTSSVAGQAALLAGTILFAGSDLPFSNAQLAAIGEPISEFPTVIIGVAMIYNLPGNPAIILNASVLSGIYLGTITMWNDPAIVALNPSVILPAIPIVPVARTAGSGTTNTFTQFLALSNIGYPNNLVGTNVVFPAASVIYVPQSNDVVNTVSTTTGAIGYVAFNVVINNPIPKASIINSSGNAIAPSVASIETSTNDLISVPTDLRFITNNTSTPNGYPITNPTFVILFSNLPTNNALVNIRQLFVSAQNQAIGESLGFGALPRVVINQFRLNLLNLKSTVNPNSTNCNPCAQ